MASQNKFANPFNGIELGEDITCGCTPGEDCQANFTYVYNPTADELTITDKSFLAAGDSIVSPNGVQIKVQDENANQITGQGDGTAPVVISTATIDDTGYIRIDYTITTDNGCTSTGFLFFNTEKTSQHTGALDPYNSIR